MTEAYKTLSFNMSGNVAKIMLDQSDSFNAVTQTMHDEITDVFTRVRTMPDARAILFGAHGKVFSAGGDFDLILADRAHPERRAALADGARQLFRSIADCPLPIVVALHGDVVGLGTTLILGCDAIVAARTARISDPHVVIGLAAGDGGCVLWPQAIGLLRAKRYLLTGDRLTAQDAHAMGLLTDLVDTAEDVHPAALALAERIAALPPLAVQATKRALNQGLRHRTEEVFDLGIQAELDTFFSDDVGEAIAAFRARRPGVFTGR